MQRANYKEECVKGEKKKMIEGGRRGAPSLGRHEANDEDSGSRDCLPHRSTTKEAEEAEVDSPAMKDRQPRLSVSSGCTCMTYKTSKVASVKT